MIIENQEAKVLQVKYFNQLSDKKNKPVPGLSNYCPDKGACINSGYVMCSAASSAMIAGFYDSVPLYGHSDNLQDYMYQDQGQGITIGQGLPELPEPFPSYTNRSACHDGAFGFTGALTTCRGGALGGIQSYFTNRDLKYSKTKWVVTMDDIKLSIDRGHPMILSISEPLGHVLVIIGYTIDEKFMVVHDPYQDMQDFNVPRSTYNYTGEQALYKIYLPETKFLDKHGKPLEFKSRYMLEIYP